jgi:hypothetical protein
MRKIMSISAFALAVATLPAALHASDCRRRPPPAAAPAGPFTMTTEQKGQYDTWPADLKAKYDAWPSAQQEYFWSLNADQQKGWWALNDTQRGQVYAMTPDQRSQIWPSIVAQVQGRRHRRRRAALRPPRQRARMPAAVLRARWPPMMPAAGPCRCTVQRRGHGQRSGRWQPVCVQRRCHAQEVPVCSRTVTDSCRNRGGV